MLFRILQHIIVSKKINIFKLIQLSTISYKGNTKKNSIEKMVAETFIIDDSHLEDNEFFGDLENEYHQKVLSHSMMNK